LPGVFDGREFWSPRTGHLFIKSHVLDLPVSGYPRQRWFANGNSIRCRRRITRWASTRRDVCHSTRKTIPGRCPRLSSCRLSGGGPIDRHCYVPFSRPRVECEG
jgi:hypothetical protein